MAVEFDVKVMTDAMRAALIIAQQQEILNEAVGTLAGSFGVNKGTAKKLITAFAMDKLEKTAEKMEDERSSLANAEIFIESIENMSFEAEDLLEDTAD